MLKSIILVSLRNLKRNKWFTFLNIFGLAIAITVSMLAIIKVNSELSFEKGFAEYERIYRINQDVYVSNQHVEAAVTPGAMGPAVNDVFPQVDNYVRIDRGSGTLVHEDREFEVEGIVKTDSTFFDVFSIDILAGNKTTPIVYTEGMAISQSLSERIFGNVDPLGQKLILNGVTPVVVTAVFEDLPSKSHLKANVIVNIVKHNNASTVSSWTDSGIFTYLKLNPNANIEKLEQKVNQLMAENTATVRQETGWESVFTLMPIAKIRLHSHRIGDVGGGSMGHIVALLAIALIVIVLAVINYTNLSVALANRRAHEVGMRKISGSPKSYIVLQFLCESIMLSLVAFLLALPTTEIGVEKFGKLTGLPLTYGVIDNLDVTLLFLGLSIFLGFLSGVYPAFVLSSFNPIKVIRKGNKSQGRKALFRNILIVSQFAAGLALIIITTVVFQQRKFLMGHTMGFDKENTIVITTHNLDRKVSLKTLKSEIEQAGGVTAVSVSETSPPESFSASNFIPEGSDNSTMLITTMKGDHDIVSSLGIKIANGRNFDPAFGTDSSAVLINQTLARQLGWDNPLSMRIWDGEPGEVDPLRVIGVVEDFHFESMHSPIKPLVIMMDDSNADYLIVRLDSGNHINTIDNVKAKWEELLGAKEMRYTFVTDNYNELYQSEEGMSKGFILLTAIAIFIACLGLVGLAAYSTSLRYKEIGIRKVMGASTVRLLLMLWWNFIRLIGISTLIAWPVAYLLLNDWLNNFAYRVDLSPWVFVLTALAGTLIAVLSVGSITYGAARQNPALSLKVE